MRFRMLPAAAALAAVLLLAGCVPSDPIITPEPVPDSTPVFASDEEALAAATEAYGKYVELADEVFRDGGLQTDRLEDVMTGAFLQSSVEGFQRAAAQGLRSTGKTTFDQVVLQQYDQLSIGPSIVVAYVCEDISGIDVVDENGKSVVSADRPDRMRFEVTFDLVPTTHKLTISQRVAWVDSQC